MKEIKVISFSPKSPQYKGRDAATILNIEDTYVAVYLSESAGGLAQVAANSEKRSVIMFNHINQKFYYDAVQPLVKEMQEKGTEALKALEVRLNLGENIKS
jgi:hypothetical protein